MGELELDTSAGKASLYTRRAIEGENTQGIRSVRKKHWILRPSYAKIKSWFAERQAGCYNYISMYVNMKCATSWNELRASPRPSALSGCLHGTRCRNCRHGRVIVLKVIRSIKDTLHEQYPFKPSLEQSMSKINQDNNRQSLETRVLQKLQP